eukprot:CAMPEP_0203919402 /NCGR_PEP_ID=MMETSP0359-20131031/59831_1 /ASSEMBLY_ACC=CAM_ASM_000338 /TAXON_ID=268821 /ORGANISM="Scrippsiella Hangoei, Strain SHTV-5" /LENGTH=47 /DNA_ID= /DNA_START= /DNA_END= /DNA_ORIENTATION=
MSPEVLARLAAVRSATSEVAYAKESDPKEVIPRESVLLSPIPNGTPE